MTAVERLRANGILRLGGPRTRFRYRRASGGAIGNDERHRIRSLRLPPAWRDVAIASSPHSRIQAVGRDRAGRWQYVYHPAHVRAREQRKHQRLMQFGARLPRLRSAVRADLRRRGLPREKVLAAIMRVLSSAFLRAGNASYAAAHHSYGVATLRRKHVFIQRGAVVFDFPGKGGKPQRRIVRDRHIVTIIRRLVALPGYEVFKYLDENGRAIDITSADVNHYIKLHMGAAFSAKDFRTWAGTLICANALARADVAGRPTGERDIRRAVATAMRETAAKLGNTPAVCRSAYVNACVPEAFADGRVMRTRFDDFEKMTTAIRRGHHPSEQALLALLSEA